MGVTGSSDRATQARYRGSDALRTLCIGQEPKEAEVTPGYQFPVFGLFSTVGSKPKMLQGVGDLATRLADEPKRVLRSRADVSTPRVGLQFRKLPSGVEAAGEGEGMRDCNATAWVKESCWLVCVLDLAKQFAELTPPR
jgi:hypothetical protein